MALHAGEAPKRKVQQAMGEAGVVGRAQHTDPCAIDAFSIELVLVAGFEAEHVAGVAEAGNLTPPVGRQLADADRAELDEVQRSSRVALRVDHCIHRVEGHSAGLALRDERTHIGILDGTGGSDLEGGLAEHWQSPWC